MSAAAEAVNAARRLRDGQPLAACPQSTILELLQLLELGAAELQRHAESDLPQFAAIPAHQGTHQEKSTMRPEDRARIEAQSGESSTEQQNQDGAGNGTDQAQDQAETSQDDASSQSSDASASEASADTAAAD